MKHHVCPGQALGQALQSPAGHMLAKGAALTHQRQPDAAVCSWLTTWGHLTSTQRHLLHLPGEPAICGSAGCVGQEGIVH